MGKTQQMEIKMKHLFSSIIDVTKFRAYITILTETIAPPIP